eukprot:6051509-Amphidinium_carterae.1
MLAPNWSSSLTHVCAETRFGWDTLCSTCAKCLGPSAQRAQALGPTPSPGIALTGGPPPAAPPLARRSRSHSGRPAQSPGSHAAQLLRTLPQDALRQVRDAASTLLGEAGGQRLPLAARLRGEGVERGQQMTESVAQARQRDIRELQDALADCSWPRLTERQWR